MANQLIHATSPYLLQHAHNPVHWQAWSVLALDEAKKLDKPILISIGYSACHWCHVMEKESFENQAIAALMNEHFVCIKIDREERPDIDHVYMEAVQAMGQQGGWPLHIFLTPDQKPFYGGTYFPPQQWARLLQQIANTFKIKRSEINESADELAMHLQRSDLQRFAQTDGNKKFSREILNNLFTRFQQKYDRVWGGIDKAPKFVMPSVWLWLLRYHFISKNEEALHSVLHTLQQMTRGGLYDQLGGGFARYSVDEKWFAPHFEKMLYDNAQLLTLFSEAYSITKDEKFKSIVYETVGWLQREMMSEDGGFYSAIDADSEGVEGKFYTWTYRELIDAVGTNSLIPDYFQATEEGNWEHGLNILWCTENTEQLQSKFNFNEHELQIQLASGKEKMIAYRKQKTQPSRDDKIMTGWNAMTIQGLTDCYRFFSDEIFLSLSLKNISFLEKNLIHEEKVYRAFKNKASAHEGFLDDYAALIQAYISLYETTFDERFMTKAKQWTTYVLKNFYDEHEKAFHFTSASSEKLIARKKEIFDNVIPSSNSIMARNLFKLGTLLDIEEWKNLAQEMTAQLEALISSEPVHMSNWAIAFSEIFYGLSEVVIAGNDCEEVRKKIQSTYIPFSIHCGTKSKSNLPLLANREPIDDETKIYICRNKVCNLPVKEISDALHQIQSR